MSNRKRYIVAVLSMALLMSFLPIITHSQTLEPPYPQSNWLSITFDWDTLDQRAPGSDNWPITWGGDDHQYTNWGDGGGFGGSDDDGRVSLGVARIEGDWDNYTGYNVWGGKDAENEAEFDGKSRGMLAIGDTLYMWRCGGASESAAYNFQELYQSTNYGATWEFTEVRFNPNSFPDSDGFFCPTFLQFGRGYDGARDNFVYSYAPEKKTDEWEVSIPGEITLMRVPIPAITDQDQYEFFAGFNTSGGVVWTSDITERQPVFEDVTNGVMRTTVSYNPGLQRYFLITEHTIRSNGNIGIYEAVEPWGPWYTVLFETGFGAPDIEPNTFFWNFANKWLSADGRDFTLVFTGKNSMDAWNSVRGQFILAPSPHAQNDNYTTAFQTTLTVEAPGVLGNDTDPEGDPLIAVLLSNPSNGVLILNEDGSFTYTPDNGFSGTDSFTYAAYDNESHSPAATVTILVGIAPNAPPLASDDIYVTDFGAVLTIPAPGLLGNDFDEDNDTLIVVGNTDPANGTVIVDSDGAFTYTPDDGFSGDDSFTYIASDGIDNSEPASVFITVKESEICPVNSNTPLVCDPDSDNPGACVPGSTTAPIRPILTWLRPASENPELYDLILWNADQQLIAFNKWFNADTLCAGTHCTLVTSAALLPYGLLNGKHELYVRIASHLGNADWRRVAVLTVHLPAPDTPDMLAVNTDGGILSLNFPRDLEAMYHQVYIGRQDTSDMMHLQWYPIEGLCCGDTCQLRLDAFPYNGDYVLYKQAFGPGGFSTGGTYGWGGPFNFSLNFPPPAAITSTAVALTGTNIHQPTFTWQGVEHATWYNVWIGTDESGTPPWQQHFTDWILAEEMGCKNGGNCTLTAGVDLGYGGVFDLSLSNGTYVWYVQSWGPGGYSVGGDFDPPLDSWVQGQTFTVP